MEGPDTDMTKKKRIENQKKRRLYIISLNRWRSIMALAACAVTILTAVYAIVSSLLEFVPDDREATNLYQFLTPNANTLTALAAALIVPFAIEGIRKKRFTYPKWVALLHYSGTICTTLVMVFSVFIMSFFDRDAAFGGHNVQLHIICPVLVLVSFFLVECNSHFTMKESMLCMIPVTFYALVYIWQVAVIGFPNGGWNDFYHMTDFVPIYVSVPFMFMLAFGISIGILKISRVLLALRRKKLTALWTDDVDPIEVKIELFGLGRFAGENGEESDIPIPLDIINMLAERYHLKTSDLIQAYARGALDGFAEKAGRGRSHQNPGRI